MSRLFVTCAGALATSLVTSGALAHDSHGASTATAAGSAGAVSPDPASAAPYGPPIADQAVFGHLIVDQFEERFGDGPDVLRWSAEAWRGDGRSRLWLKTEGQARSGQVDAARVEVLYDRPVTTNWDFQVGVRLDTGQGPGRTWAAFGVEGVAPWYARVSATAYVGSDGRLAGRVSIADELRLSQRLILEPRFEADLYSQDDAGRGLGSGLSNFDAGLRLRYEFTRKFAPYAGVTWEQRFGRTADLAKVGGEGAGDVRAVVGVRLWF